MCGFAGSCAAPAPPRPPRIERPQRVTDLAVRQVGSALEITFTRPKLATDGQLLTRPVEIEVFRWVTPPGESLPQALNLTRPWRDLAGAALGRDAHDDVVSISDALAPPAFAESLAQTFTFQVRALTRGFRGRAIEAEPSSRAQATLLDVCGPLASPRIVPTERALELSWPAPTTSLTGRPLQHLAGYRVYRSEGETPGSFQLAGEAGAPSYSDHDFEFGHTYFYRVRAVFRYGDQVAESDDSAMASLTARDVFPPRAPTGLTALYSAGSVELVWDANPEADLAGYNVYRWENQSPPEKINLELVRTPIDRDAGVTPGRTYSYQVTAVDRGGNESRPSESVAVEAR